MPSVVPEPVPENTGDGSVGEAKSGEDGNKYLLTDGGYTPGVFNYRDVPDQTPTGQDDSTVDYAPTEFKYSDVPDLTTGPTTGTTGSVSSVPSGVPSSPPRKKGHRAFLIATIGADYAGETGGIKEDQLAALQSFAEQIKEVRMALAALENGAEPRAAAKGLTESPSLKAELKKLPETQADLARAMVQQILDQLLTKARLQDVPLNDDGSLGDVSDRKVKYDSKEEQEQSAVTPTGGRLCRAGGEPVDTRESSTYFSGKGAEIFVVTNAGAIHMASHKLGKYHHSSLVAGSDVSMGGEMKVTAGKIDWITNKSGHYRPSKEHLVQFLHWLAKDGVDLSFEVKQGWGVPGGKTANDFVLGVDSTGSAAGGESYHAVKLKAALKSYRESVDDDDFDDFFDDKGWWCNYDGTVEDMRDGSILIDPKVVLVALKARFGSADARSSVD